MPLGRRIRADGGHSHVVTITSIRRGRLGLGVQDGGRVFILVVETGQVLQVDFNVDFKFGHGGEIGHVEVGLHVNLYVDFELQVIRWATEVRPAGLAGGCGIILAGAVVLRRAPGPRTAGTLLYRRP